MKQLLARLLPSPLYRALAIPYHFALALFFAIYYRFPGRKLRVIAVTGTKGKSSVVEMLATIFEGAGWKVAVSSTIRFQDGSTSRPNQEKMTLPGRGFIQKLLRAAVRSRADVAIIEITSEAAVQYRHLFLFLDAVVFTNLQKEHLESHGGMDKYFAAKLRIGKALVRSTKRPRMIIANADDPYGVKFLALPAEKKIPFSTNDLAEITNDTGISFTVGGTRVALQVPGMFNALNALAALKAAEGFGISKETSADALSSLSRIPGRTERIECGQSFTVVVDYAHTPDSLSALYSAYPGRKICVLGNTGGGRDTWKRPEMGRIADEACAEVILTDEDPYDEDPQAIVDAMAAGMKRTPTIVMDRRSALKEAFTRAQPGDTVLISGKGTDPCIMRTNGEREVWSDAEVAREELQKLRV